jgi:hypothetical protein
MAIFSGDDEKVRTLLSGIMTTADYNALSGNFYCPYQIQNADFITATTLSANVMRGIPFVITKESVLTSISFHIITINGSKDPVFRIAIYNAYPDRFYPNKRILYSEPITISDNKVIQLENLSLENLNGVYFFCLQTSATKGINLKGIPKTAQQTLLGMTSAANSNPINRIEVSQPFTSGMPPTFLEGAPLVSSPYNPEAIFIKSKPLQLWK